MYKKRPVTYNPWFYIPFLAWIVIGGILLLFFTKEQLFFAVNSHYTPFADVVMYYTTWLGEGWFIVILILLLFAISRFRSLWFVTTATLCNLVPFGLQQGLKEYFKAPRPRAYFHDSSSMHFLQGWPSLVNNSFPSGHSEGAFAFLSFASLILPEKYRKFGLVFFVLALSVCYSRIYLTAHFFADVYAGSIIGCGLTTVIYSVMCRFGSELEKDKID